MAVMWVRICMFKCGFCRQSGVHWHVSLSFCKVLYAMWLICFMFHKNKLSFQMVTLCPSLSNISVQILPSVTFILVEGFETADLIPNPRLSEVHTAQPIWHLLPSYTPVACVLLKRHNHGVSVDTKKKEKKKNRIFFDFLCASFLHFRLILVEVSPDATKIWEAS